MRLTKFTDNSLRVIIYVSANGDRKVNISEVAEACAIPRNHLTKVIHSMAVKGLITTTRGKGGGISMARPPNQLKVGEIIRAMEGTEEIINCETPKCPMARLCELRSILHKGQNAFFTAMDEYTVADLIDQPKIFSTPPAAKTSKVR